MNCKPGDLAIIVYETPDYPVAGRVVEVLYAAPTDGPYTLPDGQGKDPSKPNSWVCVSLGSPFLNRTNIGNWRESYYAAIPDFALRPLGDGESAEGFTWQPEALKETEEA